jgi:predicted nuclease of predicted toxin-antitoxin system
VRIVADENVPSEVVSALRNLGFKVDWIAESNPGLPDPAVWSRARSKGAILLTKDRGLLPQLTRDEFVNGPNIIEYRATGFSGNELPSGELMRAVVEWLVQHYSYHGKEHIQLRVDGRVRTRLRCWQQERPR